MPLPPPAEVRAIVVGIGQYPGLGTEFKVAGAAAGAWAFANWLVNELHVAPTHVQIWLAPEAAGGKPIDGVDRRELDWAALQKALDQPADGFASGRMLVVYFCGHGLVSGVRLDQYLVLPHASAAQLRCIDVANWQVHFSGPGWQRFEHQLWIIDACRNQWGPKMVPSPQTWTPGVVAAPSRFVALSCSIGQEAAIDSEQGPRFTRDLLAQVKTQGAAGWPDFAAAVRQVAADWKKDPLKGQSPILAEDWDRSPLRGDGLADETLLQVLETIEWTPDRYQPYWEHALRRSGAVLPPGAKLDQALNHLEGLKAVDGVPPLLEFAERVARASRSNDLAKWLKARLSKVMRKVLDQRIASDPVRARLSLWYRDDMKPAQMEAAVEVFDAAGGVKPWRRTDAKPIEAGIAEVIAEWVREIERHVSDQPVALEIELYLPSTLLTSEPCDHAIVGAGKEELRLGEDHAVLLHCTDRFKSKAWIGRLRQRGPVILQRLVHKQPATLRWATARDDADTIRKRFVDDAVDAPVWLAFDLAPGAKVSVALDAALAEGLPAVTWLRLPLDAKARKRIASKLPDLLSAPLDDLSGRVQSWRRAESMKVHQHLSVLLDDAQRRPKLFTKFSQP
jgi:hypothetical protein